MIPKIGIQPIAFKAAYIREDEHAKNVMDSKRRYIINGNPAPFPQDSFDYMTKTVDEFSEDRNCNVIFGFRENPDSKDSFETYAEVIDKETGDTFHREIIDSSYFARISKQDPYMRLRVSVLMEIMKYRREV